RIPLDPAKRELVWYDQYVKTGGYEPLKKAVGMTPDELIKLTVDSGLRGIRMPAGEVTHLSHRHLNAD
ncbi:MAG: hypothetical protein AAGC55_18310, partial [Myxococcota bacterium]